MTPVLFKIVYSLLIFFLLGYFFLLKKMKMPPCIILAIMVGLVVIYLVTFFAGLAGVYQIDYMAQHVFGFRGLFTWMFPVVFALYGPEIRDSDFGKYVNELTPMSAFASILSGFTCALLILWFSLG